MDDETRFAIKITLFIFGLVVAMVMLMLWLGGYLNKHDVMPTPVEAPATTGREEIVTGVCTFGGCPVVTTAATTTLPPTEMSVANTEENSELVSDTYTLSDESVAKNATTEPVTESQDIGYIGTFYITGYTAEEGFPEGSATASGYGVRPGYCAMNAEQRRLLGISYGDQIHVAGLGTYTVMDSGCDWNVVDIWVYSNAEAYAITGNYDVYLV